LVRLFLRHTVHDYETWRRHYDAAATVERPEWGVLGDGVYRTIDKPNEITIWHDFATVEEARAFQRRDRLRDLMAAAGVADAPLMWLTDPV
jgi:hypothetical protein